MVRPRRGDIDFGAAISVSGEPVDCEYIREGELRAVRLVGADGRTYIVAANFARDTRTCELYGHTFEFDAEIGMMLLSNKLIAENLISVAQ